LKTIATNSSGSTPWGADDDGSPRTCTPAVHGTAGRITLSGRLRFFARLCRRLAPILLLLAPNAPLTAGEWSFIGRGVLTSNSLLYPRTNAPSIADRALSIEFSSSIGPGVEVRYTMREQHVAVGISADDVKMTSTGKLTVGSLLSFPVEEGIRAVPVEVTGYFIIPISGDLFTVYMGGGAGVYFGRRTYRIGGAESASADVKPGFGIHVLTGLSYRFFGPLNVSLDLKFRDLQFEAENAFATRTTVIDGYVYTLPAGPIRSRSQTDGIIIQLGIGLTL
jgi:hypothetical protein